MTTTRYCIITSEEIETLSETATAYTAKPVDVTEVALEMLQSVLLPGELMRLAKRLEQAKDSGGFITVGVQFERGHARKIVYTESETLERS